MKVKNNVGLNGVNIQSVTTYGNVVNDGNSNKGEVWLSGFVGDEWNVDGVSMKNLKNYVVTNSVKKVDIMLNSGGGYVHSAMEMVSYMQLNKEVSFRVVNVGLCASAAVLLLVGADKSDAVEGSLTMIHDPAFESWNSMKSKDLRRNADVLDKMKESIVNVYISKMKKMGKVGNEDKVKKGLNEMMDAETWMTAEETKDLGFINNIIDGGKIKKDTISNSFNFQLCNSLNYKNMKSVREMIADLVGGKKDEVVVKNEAVGDEVQKALKLLKEQGYEVPEEGGEVNEVDKALNLLKAQGYDIKDKKVENVVVKVEEVVEKKVVEEDARITNIENLLLKVLNKEVVVEKKVETPKVTQKVVLPALNMGGSKVVDDEENGGEGSDKGKKGDVFKNMKDGEMIKGKLDAVAMVIKG